MKKNAFALAVALALSGCSAPPLEAWEARLRQLLVSVLESRAQAVLRQALQHYEEGDHGTAEASLRKALELGLEPGDRVLAHKTLDAAEAGPPVWGTVFRSLAR